MALVPTTSQSAPTGSAGGGLTGNYPNPTVAAVPDAVLGSGTPTSGKELLGDRSWATRVVPGQTAIADLNLGTLVLIGDVITAAGTIQSKLNTLLAELRTSNLLASS